MVKHNVPKVTVSYRISGAKEMLYLKDQLNTEQETKGPFNVLMGTCLNFLEPQKIGLSVIPEFFLGINDVIFELQIILSNYEGSKVDLVSEQILTTVLMEIWKHFDWSTYKYGWEVNDYSNNSDFAKLLPLEK